MNHVHSARPICQGLIAWLALLLPLAAAMAQGTRDPTLPPPAPLAAGAGAGSPSVAHRLADQGPLGVIVRDGKPYLMLGSRLYGVGSRVGGAQLEKIGETEIWLRDGKTLLKLPRYAGVMRQPAAPTRTP